MKLWCGETDSRRCEWACRFNELVVERRRSGCVCVSVCELLGVELRTNVQPTHTHTHTHSCFTFLSKLLPLIWELPKQSAL